MRIIATALVFCLTAAAAWAEAGPVSLVLPVPEAVMRSADALVLYETPSGMKPTVTRDGEPLPPAKVVGGDTSDLHHLSLTLKEGKNVLLFTDPATEKRVLETTLYYIPPYSLKRVSASKAKEFTFHTAEFEAKCNACHSIPEAVETVRGRPNTPSGKVCSACHPALDQVKFPHEPTATYDCFRCHETGYRPARFGINTSAVAQCGYCHQNFLAKLLGGEKYVHGPVATGDCLICHDPHGGQGKGIVREPLPGLCLRCHSDTVDLDVEKGLHKGMSCDKCHVPHAAGNPSLTTKGGAQFCMSCHEDPDTKLGGHPLAGHPSRAPVDPSKPGRPMTCASCHKVHGGADISQTDILDNTDLQRRFCNRCHY